MSTDQLSASMRLSLEEICDRFEMDWRSGTVRPIEEYLGTASGVFRSRLLRELLAVEIEYRRLRGDNPSTLDYAGRFDLPGEVIDSLFPKATAPISLPADLAHFDLVEQLGVGSFGTVWKARDRKLGREVALKIAHRNLVEDSGRFLREARASAQLKHPCIVRVLDAGQCDDLLYIVREYVDGQSLATVLTQRLFDPREAAELCLRMADALLHSHAAGCIHRDLKPHNILVDVQGVPYLTDFGLAKSTALDHTATRPGVVMGTAAYMAPEQARGDSHLADERTDIYSLGVILFQLLTGEVPFRGSFEKIVLQVLHEDPPSPARLNHHVPADLATICLKCLEKDPVNRYSNAEALSTDLRRFLDGRTIVARPLSWPQQAWRWVRRNPIIATLTGAIVLLSLLLSVGVAMAISHLSSAWKTELHLRQHAEKAQDRAQQEAIRARSEAVVSQQVVAFLESVFLTSDPISQQLGGLAYAGGGKLTAREMLDRAALRIDKELAGQPRVQARLMDVIANVYRSLGRFPEAGRMLDQASKIRERLLVNNPELDLRLDQATSDLVRGRLKQFQGEFADAQTYFQQALGVRQEVLGTEDAQVVEVLFYLGWLHLDRKMPSKARDYFEQVLHNPQASQPGYQRLRLLARLALVQCSTGTSVSPLLLTDMDILGNKQMTQAVALGWQILRARKEKKYEVALSSYVQVLELIRKELGEDHPLLALALGDYAGLLWEMGKYGEAYRAIQEAFRIGLPLAPGHPQVQQALRRLAFETLLAGRYTEAEKYYRLILEGNPEKVIDRVDAYLGLSYSLVGQGKHADALEWSNRVRKILPQCPPELVVWGKHWHARLLDMVGQGDEAASLDAEVRREIDKIALDSLNPIMLGRFAVIHAHAKEYVQAEKLAREALKREEATHPTEHPRIADALVNVAHFLLKQGQTGDAEPYLRRALQIREHCLPAEDPRIANLRKLMENHKIHP